jgi:predicted transcriptional regulator
MPNLFTVTGQQLHRQLGQLLAAPVLRGELDPLELVRAAHEVLDRAEALTAAAVQQAREAGRTWQEIGEVLGVSRQAVFQRYGKPVDPRTGEVMNTSALPEAEDLARTVIDDLAHGRWAEVSARFDATMRDRLTEEGLAEAWAHIVALAGTYESHGDTDAQRAGDFTTTNTPLIFEAGDFVARITFRDDRTLAGLYILNADAAGGSAAT